MANAMRSNFASLASPKLLAYFVPRAQNAGILGDVPTNSDFGAAKRRRGSMQELRINK